MGSISDTYSDTYSEAANTLVQRVVWWLGFAVCAFYGGYALYMAAVGIVSFLGLVEGAPHRAAPLTFIVHALSGGVALVSGSLQLNRELRSRRRALHRVIGRIYVASVWIASAAGLWVAAFLDASAVARAGFGVLAVLWFATTTVAFLRIRSRRVAEHRAWMIRSFSLTLFFITFSFWVPEAASANLRAAGGYALGVWLSWSLNLLVAEAWIRRTRQRPVPELRGVRGREVAAA